MSSFPPKKWEIRYLRDMDDLAIDAAGEDNIAMEALLAVRPAEGEEGNFRFALAGTEDLRLLFPVNMVLTSELFAGMHVEAHLSVADHIHIEKNSASSKWSDITDMVSSQDIEIVDGEGEVISEQFLTTMAEYKKTAQAQQSGKH